MEEAAGISTRGASAAARGPVFRRAVQGRRPLPLGRARSQCLLCMCVCICSAHTHVGVCIHVHVYVCAGGWVGWRTRVRGGLPVQTCMHTQASMCACPSASARAGTQPQPTHPKPQSLAAPEPNYSLGLNLCSEAQPKCGVGGGASLHPRTIVDTRARTHTLRSSPRLTPPLRHFLGANCGGSVRPPSGAEVYLEVY